MFGKSEFGKNKFGNGAFGKCARALFAIPLGILAASCSEGVGRFDQSVLSQNWNSANASFAPVQPAAGQRSAVRSVNSASLTAPAQPRPRLSRAALTAPAAPAASAVPASSVKQRAQPVSASASAALTAPAATAAPTAPTATAQPVVYAAVEANQTPVAVPKPKPSPRQAQAAAPKSAKPAAQKQVASIAPEKLPKSNLGGATGATDNNGAKAATAPATDAVKKTAKKYFRWPIQGRVITQFGEKVNGAPNDGIDISAPEGTKVKAAEKGTVIYSGSELAEFGNLVLISHDGGWVSAYAYAKENHVKRGDKVARGQVIADSGKSGNAKSPKLHFELRKDSTPVDPMKHLVR